MAPQTKLAARTPEYLARYGRTLNAAYRFERIQKEIADEQGRVQYLDSLIGQERQTLAALQETFKVEQLGYAELQTLLAAQASADKAANAAAENAAKGRQAALTVGEADRAKVRENVRVQGQAQLIAQNFQNMARNLTPEKAKALAVYAKQEAAKVGTPKPDQLAAVNKLIDDAAATASGKPPAVGGKAATTAQVAASAALQEALYASPAGIRGGPEAALVAETRNLTADELAVSDAAAADALRKSGYVTQKDAFDAALKVVRETGDIMLADKYAQEVYQQALAKQAYRNDQAADFSQEVLDSRKRLAKLEGERQKIAGRYDDPVQEAIKRELTARGYKFAERGSADEWKNKYVQYQNTPLYDVLLSADRLVDTAKNTGKPLAPSTKAQNMVTTLAMQYERSETPFDLNTLRTQLEKAPDLSKKDVDDALSFIVAYRELGGEKQDPDSIAFLKRQDELQKQEDEARRAQAEAIKAEVERAREVTRKLEEDQVKAVSELRTEQNVANLGPAEYARLRAMGMSPEEARAKAMRVVPAEAPQTAQAAAKVLMEPDLLMERQRRVEAAREAAQAAPPPAPTEQEKPPEQDDSKTFQEPGTPYSYRKTSKGDYVVFKNGFYSGTARAGTREAQSIERVMAGQAPLPPKPPKPAASTAAKAKAASDAEYEAIVDKKGLTPLEGAGTPVKSTPPTTPARKTKQVWDEATGAFKTVEVP